MTSDEPLDNAIELLKQPAKYVKTYGGITSTEDEMVIQPIVSSIRALIGEVQALKDELEELRNAQR